jgi:chromatin remodeling complex protein RSC6
MSSNNTTGVNTMSSTSAPKTAAKRVAKKTDAPAAPAPVAAAAPAAPAAPAKAPKAAATKKEKTATPAPAAPVAAPSASEVAAPSTEAAPTRSVSEQIADLIAEFTKVRDMAGKAVAALKKLDKQQARDIKEARKRRKSKKTEEAGASDKPKKPNVFENPNPISNALCDFFGRAHGSQMSRAEVTSEIAGYIKRNSLQNKHEIKPDAKLTSLLGLKEGDKLTYFNIQKYLNTHYLNNAASKAAAATA